LKELDSIQKQAPQSEKCLHLITGSSKVFTVTENNTQEELLESFKILLHNLPKVLFLFMPFSPLIFGFPQKKRWYYFDHGILHFTIFVPVIDFLTALSY
jgi:hypothetical protein